MFLRIFKGIVHPKINIYSLSNSCCFCPQNEFWRILPLWKRSALNVRL